MSKAREQPPKSPKPSQKREPSSAQKQHNAAFWLICAGLAATTLAIFWSIQQHDFVNLDDQVYVTDNEHVRGGMTWENVRWAFGNLEAGFWHPMTWLSIMLDCQLYGLKAGGHHLTSLLLHTANSVLLFILLRRLTGTTWRSGFVAALFALHPLHVETVAWAADRKDVLSTFFLMLTLLAYVKYVNVQRPKPKVQSPKFSVFSNGPLYYGLSLLLFALGLMSKTMLVTLPFVLLLLDWWPMGRFSQRDGGIKRLLIEKAPYLGLSVIAGMLTLHAEKGVGALANANQFPLDTRIGNALLSGWGYIAQMFWPSGLAVFYPYPESLVTWRVVLAGLLLIAITAGAWKMAARRPYLMAGWCWYLATLGPVIGLIQVGAHAHADRYTYVPLIGLFLMVTWGLYDLAKERRQAVVGLAVAGCVALVVCAVQTGQQLAHWRNSETLFRHATKVTSRNAMAHYCLGLYLSRQQQSDEAIGHFKSALEIDPAHAEAHDNLGVELAMKGNLEAAIGHFNQAIKFKPSLAGAHANLGMALAAQHKFAEAVREYRTSLELKPNDPRVHSNLGNALDDEGKSDQAVVEYEEALRLEPSNTEIRLNLAMTLAKQGKRQEAIMQYNEVLRLKPQDTEARRALQTLNAQQKL